jgi:hypothetical protein
MDINEAVRIFTALEGQEKVLANKLKAIRSKTRPAKKAIMQHLLDSKMAQLEVGSTVFKVKKSTTTKINKKTFVESTCIPQRNKQQFIEQNTTTEMKVTTSKKKP